MPIKPTSTDPAIRLFAASKAHHWSADNVAGAVTVLERCRTWLAAEHATTLLEADRLALQLYINDRAANGTWKGKRLSPNTIIVEHRQLRAFYKWAAAGDDPLILRSPMGSVEAPKAVDPDPASMPVLSEAHYRDMLAACLRKRSTRDLRNDRAHARRDAAILAVMWATGGRRAEIAALRLCDVDWDAQTVHFAKTKGRGKTKSRDAYFDDEALEYLTRYIVVRGDHEGPLFESMRRHPEIGRAHV